jgi:hypothetical protein
MGRGLLDGLLPQPGAIDTRKKHKRGKKVFVILVSKESSRERQGAML